jgi:hypothetical protein
MTTAKTAGKLWAMSDTVGYTTAQVARLTGAAEWAVRRTIDSLGIATRVGLYRLVGEKRRAAISEAKTPFLNAVIALLYECRKYWPVTDRHVHYGLLNDPPLKHASKPDSRYDNDKASYKATCDLVTRARLQGDISFACIHDPTRPVTAWDVFGSLGPFVRRELNDFLKGYYRDLQLSQPSHIEIIGEKNTIEGIVRRVAMRYRIPYTIGRGYCSLPPRHAMARRFEKSGKEELVLLVLSDFDPEGEDIAQSFARSMRDDFGIDAIRLVKVALTAEQVEALNLPPMMKAKKTSSRYKGFARKHGDDVYELEAVPPPTLEGIMCQAIDGVMDLDLFNCELDLEKKDAALLDVIRRQVHGLLGNIQCLKEVNDEEE